MNEHLDGQPWSLTGITGTMAAALGANSIVFAMGAPADTALTPGSNAPRRARVEIEALKLTYTAIVVATTPLTSGRCLQLFKADQQGRTLPTGGSSITPVAKSPFRDAGADNGLTGAVIATTAALTVTGFTRNANPLATFDLVGGGAAGTRLTFDYFEQFNGSPLWIDPGDILVISNPNAIDAALTWSLSVNIDYRRRDAL